MLEQRSDVPEIHLHRSGALNYIYAASLPSQLRTHDGRVDKFAHSDRRKPQCAELALILEPGTTGLIQGLVNDVTGRRRMKESRKREKMVVSVI